MAVFFRVKRPISRHRIDGITGEFYGLHIDLGTANTVVYMKGKQVVGGGALLKNLDILLQEVTSVPITIADDPLSAVVLGAGRVLEDVEPLKNTTVSF